MGRKDWYYVTISTEMAEALESIVKKHGRRYGIFDKQQLVRTLLGDFITEFDKGSGMIEAKQSIKKSDILNVVIDELGLEEGKQTELNRMAFKHLTEILAAYKEKKDNSGQPITSLR